MQVIRIDSDEYKKINTLSLTAKSIRYVHNGYDLSQGSASSCSAVGLSDGSSWRQRTMKAAVEGISASCNML